MFVHTAQEKHVQLSSDAQREAQREVAHDPTDADQDA
jgi:hypothetical protein